MSFPRYGEYKDSGADWLGQVPAHWGVIRTRWICRIQKRIVGELGYDVLSITQQGIKIKDIDSNDGQLSMDYSKYQLVEVGDFAMNHMDLLTGYVDIATSRGVTSPDYRVFSVRDCDRVLDKYLLYLFQSCYHNKVFFAFGQGSSQFGRWRLPTENFNDFRVPLPPRDEQVAVVALLDDELAKIDALVAEQEQLITLLKEKRQAVISHAVTKGLDPSVPMKDSGVEWLGEVPAYWDVRAIKHIVATPITDGPHETPAFPDEGIPFVSAEAVSTGVIDFERIRGFISEEDHARYSQKYKPKRGDIFMVKSGATTGVTAMVETDMDFNIWSPLAVIRAASFMSPQYVLQFMRSLNFQEAVTLNWSFGTQQNIGMGVIENLAIAVPPLVEQASIAAHLGELLDQFEPLISEATQAIQLLQERRSALISAAVTGQIDVRGLGPAQEQAA